MDDCLNVLGVGGNVGWYNYFNIYCIEEIYLSVFMANYCHKQRKRITKIR